MASITVNGKEYTFKQSNQIGVNKRARKILRDAAFNDPVKVDADEDTSEWRAAATDWLKFCNIIFEPPRRFSVLDWFTRDSNWCEREKNLYLGNLTLEKYTEILEGFFGGAETKTPP